jgi:hypothetical protein
MKYRYYLDIMDYKGKYVLLLSEYYNGKNPLTRIFFCSGGEGSFSNQEHFIKNASIFGEFLSDGEKCKIQSFHIDRIASEHEINNALEIRTNNKIKPFKELIFKDGL